MYRKDIFVGFSYPVDVLMIDHSQVRNLHLRKSTICLYFFTRGPHTRTLSKFFGKKVSVPMEVEHMVPGVVWFTVSQAQYHRLSNIRKWVFT